jgi:choline-glycine betaine transporter
VKNGVKVGSSIMLDTRCGSQDGGFESLKIQKCDGTIFFTSDQEPLFNLDSTAAIVVVVASFATSISKLHVVIILIISIEAQSLYVYEEPQHAACFDGES